MPDPTDKRAAAIEALVAVSHGEPPHTPTTMRRATAAIDALAAYLRAPEDEGGGTSEPRCARCGCMRYVHTGDGDCQRCRHFGKPCSGYAVDTKTSGPEPTPRTAQVAAGDHRREPVTEKSADSGTESTAHTAPQRVPEDCGISSAPSEEGEGPEVWINLEMGRYVEKASRDRYVYDACDWERRNHVRYVPAAAAERRIAELEAERDTLAGQMRDATAHIIGLDDALAKADQEAADVRRDLEQARAALIRYGHHDGDCLGSMGEPCTCGYAALSPAVPAPDKAEPRRSRNVTSRASAASTR